ncbi:MAPK/MAK/MRK overlapping kinase isoform 4-T5 [Glossophaga mutica]
MKNYRVISKIGEGTFSEVVKTQSLRDGHYYACKQMKQPFESSVEQANGLREVRALRRLNPHPHILALHEVVFDRKSGSLALICELMDMNIYELIRGRRRPLSERRVARYMYQLCRALDHVHRNGIFHRDVKPENILIKDVLKLGDFGSCRSVYAKQPHTEYISTRWYRAPECLLTDGCYSYKMDLWSAGCVLYEIASLQPLFPGANELDQISKIHDVMGTPPAKTLTKFKQSRAMSFDFPFKKGSGIPLLTASLPPQGLSLLHAMVAYDPDERITAHQALQHPYFREQRAAEKQAPGGHRNAVFPERPAAADPRSGKWQVSKESRKQQPPLQQEEDRPRRPGPASPTELPRLKLSGVPRLLSSGLELPSVFGCRGSGSVPGLRPLKCGGANQKTHPRKELKPDPKPDLKQCRLPAVERRGGGC